MSQTKKFIVTRFDPDVDEVPKTQSYEVECDPDWKVLEALNHIKDHIDPSLSAEVLSAFDPERSLEVVPGAARVSGHHEHATQEAQQ